MSSDQDPEQAAAAGFLSRWSRRKRGEAAAGTDERIETVPGETGEPDSGALAGSLAERDETASPSAQSTPAQPVLTDDDMPDIETLGEESDYGQFMGSGVSDALRKRALAKLFHLPAFGVRDGLDDYDDDFRTFQALGDMITTDMKFEKRRLVERAEEAAEREAALAELAAEDENSQPRGDEGAVAAVEETPGTGSRAVTGSGPEADADTDVDDDSGIGDAEDDTA